ncbi:MAG: Gfo/Idh/MocA family oxidoreductase [Planctomycetota bacterium]
MSADRRPSRRSFISTSAKASAGTVLGTGLISPSYGYHNSVNDVLKIGLVGCGGRGTGAVLNATNADSNTVVTGLADAFMDRIEICAKSLKVEIGEKFKVADDHMFDGLDCYKNLIESDVDVVLLATPPYFRPMQLKAAVEAGKHVFCEKPVGVDVPGVRSVLESCELAAKKGLSVVSGLCWRYDLGVNEMIKRIKDGEIGEIRAMEANYLTGTLWHRGDKPEWSPMEYQLRNWLYFNWLSGDHIAEQHIHSLDKTLWLMEDIPPMSCYASGGRLVRTEKKWGNVYDHFSTVYQWEDSDIRVFSHCRQMSGCFNETDDHVIGTKGTAHILKFQIENDKGKNSYRKKKPSMYDLEHQALFQSIRSGNPINNGRYMSFSTLMALMGRDAAYSGKKIMWNEYMDSEKKLGPEDFTDAANYVPDDVIRPGDKW